ncbi:probable inactive receptor kinase At3g02880 [Chenopodium quinoa]|uniref:probable inactive receptor kinase At3g02880 n=1 Tax=Chenopodium quinoa TaxID=63459 RepID=UPI000B76FFB1|nr:probable inactive receptor kinase At3g02880 [Chenopodium quinoa]
MEKCNVLPFPTIKPKTKTLFLLSLSPISSPQTTMKSTTKQPPTLVVLLLAITFALSLLPTATPADADPSDSRALSALKAALPGRWNTSASNACQWQGVVCNAQGRVIELHLPGVGLIGRIPNNVLGNLSSLNFLSLRYNALSGNIPSDFSSLSQLRYLYLQNNNLSGDIPAVLFSMKNLFRLDLSGNRFSGGIPLGFNNLTNLATLYLQSNQLTGSIPDLKIGNLKQFNVSHNLLTGSIPSQFCGMPSTAFEGNSLTACAATAPSANPNDSGGGGGDGGEKKKKKLSAGAIAAIVIGCVIALLVILLLIFFCCCRKKKKTEQQPGTRSVDAVAAAGAAGGAKQSDVESGAAERAAERNGESSGAVAAAAAAAKSSAKSGGGVDKTLVFFGNGPRVFDLDDLLRASAEVLGKGNYGTTYKASLDNGVAVAVKRLKDVTVSEKEFREKLEEIGRLEHENLVGLRAYHCSANEKLLVYDYFPMGSLSALLHGNRGGGRTPLNWETRSAIALGAARGITYVHSQNPTASHGNIKSSNILLTNSYEARVSDSGLAQLASPSATPNRVAGYRAPEITDARRVSQKADVYSFGIFLLELLTGKAPTHALLNEEGVDLPRWVQSVVREEWAAEVFDMELLRYQNVEEEMVKLLQLAIDCCAQYPDSRPSMDDVTSRIEEICQSTLTSGQDPLADIISDPENTPSKPS